MYNNAWRVKRKGTKMGLRKVLVAFLMVLFVSVSEVSGAESFAVDETEQAPPPPKIDRWAFKTNAFEWLLTIPNFGVEYDLVNSPFNKYTVGLTAKYNWNTYHKYTPPTVFNILDIRPEFRYYYRETQKGNKKVDEDGNKIKYGFTARENPKPWRAYYLGGYSSIATYTFKFGKKGHQGTTIGLGATAGYGLPLYQYNSGVIDLEFGLSLGLQVTTHEKFEHNPDGYFYTKLEKESRGMHFTPFPVLSEVKVAFVWRHKSIEDKVQEDEEKKKQQERLQQARLQISEPFQDAKAKFDEQLGWIMDEREIAKLKKNDSTYAASFQQYINDEASRLRESTIPNLRIDDEMKEQLSAEMEGLIINAFVEFNNILYEAKKAHAKENGLDVKSIVKPTFGLEDYKGKKPKAPKAPKAPKPPKPEKEKKVKEKKK
jgi:hypothetical protein